MKKDSAQAKISLKVVGGLLFLTHPVYYDLNMLYYKLQIANSNYGSLCYIVLVLSILMFVYHKH